MMMKKLAPHFGQELKAAGLDGIGWSEEGELFHHEFDPTSPTLKRSLLTPEQEALLAELVEAHDPDAPQPRPARSFSKRLLFGELTDAEYAIWEQVESQQTPRRQRMLREAVELNEADEDYPDLYMAMVAAFGQERADEVLTKAELA